MQPTYYIKTSPIKLLFQITDNINMILNNENLFIYFNFIYKINFFFKKKIYNYKKNYKINVNCCYIFIYEITEY